MNFGPKKIPDNSYNAYAMSIDAGIELLKQQKAKIVIVGSSDKNIFCDKFKNLIDKPSDEIYEFC